MPKEPPFDVWDGEGLDTADGNEVDGAEEAAMHLDPDSDAATVATSWSDLTGSTDGHDRLDRSAPVWYFSDEQPEGADGQFVRPVERELEVDVYLKQQHYSF